MTAVAARGERTSRRLGLTTVAVVGAAQAVAITFAVGPPLQPLLSVLFVLTCPGFLLMDLERPRDRTARLMISIGGSVSINVAIATVVLVAEARWIAPSLALLLVAVAALPQDRLRDAVSKLGSLTGLERPRMRALPANATVMDAPGEEGPATAASEDTQIATTVGIGDTPELANLEVAVFDEDEAAPKRLDVNLADVDDLMALPGVGRKLAERIVLFRAQQGPFERFEDLLLVPGIGPSRMRQLPDHARVGPAAPPSPPSPAQTRPVTPQPPPPPRRRKQQPSRTAPQGLDINAATFDDLVALPGVGRALAQRIIDHREANGPFASVADLAAVSGIGTARLATLDGSIRV